MAGIWDDTTLAQKIGNQLTQAGKTCTDASVLEVINTMKIVYEASDEWTTDAETIDTRIRTEVLARAS